MNLLIVLPVLLPLLTGVGTLLLRSSTRIQHVVSITGSAGFLASAILLLVRLRDGGILAVQLGNWPAPFGITFVADLFSALMVLLTAVIGFTVALYSIAAIDLPRIRYGYHPLLHFLLMGVSGAFLTGDMFNLYVWFEVMLIASFVLLVLGGEKAQFAGAVKYVTVNLLASMLFLIGAGVLYGKTGTLNFADLAFKLAQNPEPALVNTSAILFLVAFGIKAAVFPFFFWLPDSYHVPPAAVTALFSGLLTKVGVYALMRTFSMIFIHDMDFTGPLFLVLAGLTMVIGVFGAVAQGEMKRLLSFHIVSQIGYALMGLGIFTQLALSGAIYFTLHVAIAKAALFFVVGYVARRRGHTNLARLGGLLRESPLVAVLFLLAALSLAGLPPFSGFFAKFTLIKAGLEASQYAIVAVALLVSMMTLFSMTKIWNEAFWKDAPERMDTDARVPAPYLQAGDKWLYILPIILLVGITIVMGLAAEPILQMTGRAAEQLLDPAPYIRQVLGRMP
ncbi:MAG: Na+/H+ antiporter subunit D [Bacteroidetes bacterium]|nr:Na+/H+ antiporter subunit D [Bacteroidota bacterium]